MPLDQWDPADQLIRHTMHILQKPAERANPVDSKNLRISWTTRILRIPQIQCLFLIRRGVWRGAYGGWGGRMQPFCMQGSRGMGIAEHPECVRGNR